MLTNLENKGKKCNLSEHECILQHLLVTNTSTLYSLYFLFLVWNTRRRAHFWPISSDQAYATFLFRLSCVVEDCGIYRIKMHDMSQERHFFVSANKSSCGYTSRQRRLSEVWVDKRCLGTQPSQHMGCYAVPPPVLGCCPGWHW